jgi:polyphenol oxidase
MSSILRSQILNENGFKHGFSTKSRSDDGRGKLGSDGAGAGNERQRAPDYGSVAAAVGYPADHLFEVEQVHGNTVVTVTPGDEVVRIRATRADALVATRAPAVVGVRVADCLPLLLADLDSGAVAAVHAGWRGVAARVVPTAIETLCTRAGARPERIRGAIFPHIGPCCFEVGPEVADELSRVDPGANAVDRSYQRPHVDLAAIVYAQLRQCGIAAAHVEKVSGCTRCQADRFFSYRREGSVAGRHLAVIAARG